MRQPLRTVTFDPVENSRAQRSQQRHIVGEEHEADWKHPQSGDRQKPKNPTERQQDPHCNPESATGWLPQPANHCVHPLRQSIDELIDARVIGAHYMSPDFVRLGTARGESLHFAAPVAAPTESIPRGFGRGTDCPRVRAIHHDQLHQPDEPRFVRIDAAIRRCDPFGNSNHIEAK
jgi:hypothetical protein